MHFETTLQLEPESSQTVPWGQQVYPLPQQTPLGNAQQPSLEVRGVRQGDVDATCSRVGWERGRGGGGEETL